MWKNKLLNPRLLVATLICLLLAITYLSLTPKYTVSVGNDKLGHLIAYTVLMTNAGLLSILLKHRFIFPIVLTLLYGALMEVGQHFVPGRDFSGLDLVANTSGIAIGSVLSILLFHFSTKQST